jgi:tetratricopeptide (TPR) repeat protein
VRIAGAVAGWGGKVHAVERAAAARRPSASRDAYQDYLIAVELEHGGTVGALREAIAHVDRALARDPGFARAWLVSYFSWSQLANRTAGAEALRALRKSLRAIDRAFALDPHDPMIVACYAYGCGRRGDLVAAANWAMRACDIGWNDAGAATVAANALIAMVGDFDRAREMLDRAGRLDPNPPAWRRFAAARLAFFTGEFARVATIAEGDRGHALLAGLRVLALAMLDRPEAVAAEADFDARFGAGALDGLADAQGFAAAATLARWREAMERLRALRKPMSVHRPCRS